MADQKKLQMLGQDLDMLVAVVANLLSWFVHKFFPSLLPHLLPTIEQEETSPSPLPNQTKCIAIGRPGGMEQLRLITLKPGYVTVGYNMGYSSPFANVVSSLPLPPNSVILRVHAFSINYADVCIRWGLYESAKKFVGWPIVPGFDIAGVVERVADDNDGRLQVGDRVFGATFFGAYSTRVLVSALQLRKIPEGLTMSQAASLPAVSLTALYSLTLGGQFPISKEWNFSTTNRSILIHSAAGGVGSMLVQLSKLLNLSPVVGVVGRSSKVEAAMALGCDVVIDKSKEDLWEAAARASPKGYAVITDANGVSTLGESYRHLAAAGRVIVFGFHSNLPMGQDLLSPMEWLRMLVKMIRMPKFDPMDLVVSSKSVCGFNLSFFVDEIEMLGKLYDQIAIWIQEGKLTCPRIVEMNFDQVGEAHALLHSGASVGKVVINCVPADNNEQE
jgi:NADPH:quinone reductase-like Zn-dependent oxidoreductase